MAHFGFNDPLSATVVKYYVKAYPNSLVPFT